MLQGYKHEILKSLTKNCYDFVLYFYSTKMDASSFTLPQGKLFTSIVVPTILRSARLVPDVLARMPNLASALVNRSDQALAFNARNDAMARPLYGTRTLCSQLLVRVVRKKRPREETVVHVEGIVDAQWSFDLLADYQLCGAFSNRRELGLEDDVDTFVDGFSGSVLPPVWACLPHPQEYNFGSLERNKDIRSRPRKVEKIKIVLEEDAPLKAPEAEAPKSREEIGLLAELEYMFLEVRPVFGWDVLLLHLWKRSGAKPNVKLVKDLLPRVAYMFSNGPFFRLWVRFGFDVKKDSSARFLQTFVYRASGKPVALEPAVKPIQAPLQSRSKKRLSTNVQEQKKDISVEKLVGVGALKEGGGKFGEEGLEMLERKLAMQAHIPNWGLNLQLCDLAFEPVRSLVFKSIPAKACSMENGWFEESVMVDIREAIVERKSKLKEAEDEPLWPCPSFTVFASNPAALFDK
jgi:hypothetical protein